LLHLEPFLDEALVTLKADLPGRIAALNTEFNDFELPVPDPEEGYGLGAAPVITAPYPYVEVAAPDWSMENFALDQIAADLSFQVIVRSMLDDPDADVLYRKTMRFSRCVLETMLQEDAFGGGVTVGRVSGSYRVDPRIGEQMMIVGASALQFELEDVEMRPII
jgi:hypothetical protein